MNVYWRWGVYIIAFLFTVVILLLVAGFAGILFIETIARAAGWNNGLGNILIFSLFIIGSSTLIFLYYIKHLSKPLIHLMIWIKNLASEVYEEPEVGKSGLYKNGKIKKTYYVYHEAMSHMQRLTEVLRISQKEREQIEQLKKEWGAGISHDLKTPLTYIKSYCTMLVSPDYQWSREEKQTFLHEVLGKVNHLDELIQDLNLSFQMDHRNIPLIYETQDIVEFLREIMVDVANDPRANTFDFSLDCSVERLEATYDPKLLSRVIYNLLMNAVLHNPKRTRIKITIKKDERVRIGIHDNGSGMDEATRAQLFNRYYRGSTTSQQSEGTGLGMVIVKQLVLAHRGEIDVSSKPNKGTSVYIALPKHPQ